MSNTNNLTVISLGSLCSQLPVGTLVTLGTGSQWRLQKSFEESGPLYLISLTKDTPTLTLEQAQQFFINGENLNVTLPDTPRGKRVDTHDDTSVGGGTSASQG